MKKLKIYYQTDRKEIQAHSYYPEDEKTPQKRINFIKELAKKREIYGDYIIVTACPYITEAIVKSFNNYEIEAYIDEVKSELNDIFKLFAQPMKEMFLWG